MERTEPTAEASLAAIRARSKFGIAMAAMIKMIATTISNSMSEKPFWFFFISVFSLELVFLISLVRPGGVRFPYCKADAKMPTARNQIASHHYTITVQQLTDNPKFPCPPGHHPR